MPGTRVFGGSSLSAAEFDRTTEMDTLTSERRDKVNLVSRSALPLLIYRGQAR